MVGGEHVAVRLLTGVFFVAVSYGAGSWFSAQAATITYSGETALTGSASCTGIPCEPTGSGSSLPLYLFDESLGDLQSADITIFFPAPTSFMRFGTGFASGSFTLRNPTDEFVRQGRVSLASTLSALGTSQTLFLGADFALGPGEELTLFAQDDGVSINEINLVLDAPSAQSFVVNATYDAGISTHDPDFIEVGDIGVGQTSGLQYSITYMYDDTPITVVPVPAAGLLFASALGSLVGLAKRRRKSMVA